VIADARRYLGELERRDHRSQSAGPQQLLDLEAPRDAVGVAILETLAATDPDALSPRDALALLFRLKEQAR
jgi:DNA mismatch repair protein MutS